MLSTFRCLALLPMAVLSSCITPFLPMLMWQASSPHC